MGSALRDAKPVALLEELNQRWEKEEEDRLGAAVPMPAQIQKFLTIGLDANPGRRDTGALCRCIRRLTKQSDRAVAAMAWAIEGNADIGLRPTNELRQELLHYRIRTAHANPDLDTARYLVAAHLGAQVAPPPILATPRPPTIYL